MYCFFPFSFINVIIFVINTWDLVGAESCVKVCFGSFEFNRY